MKILHYALGFPPERSGGLVRYALDLMQEQVKQGHQVYYLYPGLIALGTKKMTIKVAKKHQYPHFYPFALVNSLPLPLFGGIKTPADFMRPGNQQLYRHFLERIQPDVIHIHTLMGLHREFFVAAHELGIRIVFTSHDYFGLAPEPTFYFQGQNYDQQNSAAKWAEIGQTAMPTWQLRLFQTRLYPQLRRLAHHLKPQKAAAQTPSTPIKLEESAHLFTFTQLRQYYQSIFSLVDFFHFNSKLALAIYQHNLPLKNNYACISISNASIGPQQPTHVAHQPLQIAYIGPYERYKGFFEFLRLPQLLGTKAYQYHLYGSDAAVNVPAGIINHGRFAPSRLPQIYRQMDLVIIPSLWQETFGFVTIEALNHGVKVLASQHVGAKDLVPQPFVFKEITEVPRQIAQLASYQIKPQKTMAEHCRELLAVYQLKRGI